MSSPDCPGRSLGGKRARWTARLTGLLRLAPV
jgi:hypothetical protein